MHKIVLYLNRNIHLVYTFQIPAADLLQWVALTHNYFLSQVHNIWFHIAYEVKWERIESRIAASTHLIYIWRSSSLACQTNRSTRISLPLPASAWSSCRNSIRSLQIEKLATHNVSVSHTHTLLLQLRILMRCVRNWTSLSPVAWEPTSLRFDEFFRKSPTISFLHKDTAHVK